MKRFLLFGLCITVLGFSGCGSVRGFRFASVNSPCDDVCVVTPRVNELELHPNSSSSPDSLTPPTRSVPKRSTQETEDDIPAPPPAELDHVTLFGPPIRKPILIPIQQTAFKVKEKVAATLQ